MLFILFGSRRELGRREVAPFLPIRRVALHVAVAGRSIDAELLHGDGLSLAQRYRHDTIGSHKTAALYGYLVAVERLQLCLGV